MTRRPTAAELLEGPRGRRLCLQVAGVLDPAVDDAGFMVAHERSTPDEVVRRLRALDVSSIEAQDDPLAFVWQVADSVTFARYWQEPDETDGLLATASALRDALVPVAEAVLAAPGTAWWSSPVDLDAQHQHALGPAESPLAGLSGAAERLATLDRDAREEEVRSARDRPRDPRAAWSGWWWSAPIGGLPHTARRVGGLGSVTLLWEEDSDDLTSAVLRRVRPTRTPRVREIDSPAAWAALVEEFPREVTASRRHDWFRLAGHDHSWWIPDWSAVATAYDGVHVTVTCYLTTATRAVETPALGPDAATVLAAWSPDTTFWLTDVLEAAGDPEQWADDEDDRPEPETLGPGHGWRPAAPHPSP